MADKRKPRTRFEMIMEYLRSLRDSEEETPKKKKKGEKSIAELINFGGDYEDRSEGGVLVGEDTGKTVEKTGRTIYKTEEGHDVSELSVTFKYKDKWINIPSIVMGEELTEDELRELLDEGLIKPTSTHDDLKEAEKAAEEHSKSLKFNKGGTSMDEQMKMFGEGGLLDEGGEVDEKSGNDVPIGGTKEGVRDDIPAMLSEGEFVFPEDVTRYHGLEKLMTLRQEAKMGLKKMEAMGQMGNSEEATIPDDLPFTMDDLILVVGEEADEKDDKPIKAQAGTFVPSQQNIANVGVSGTQQSIYQQPNAIQPATPLTPPASSLVPTVEVPQVDGYSAPTVLAEQVQRPNFVPDVSSQYKPVKYINPTSGETMMINEYQGNPVSAVPAGFIRYDDYIAQGGKDPSEEVTGTATGTGVETAQVATGGRSTDDEKRETEKLFNTLKTDAERKRVDEYNKVFNTDNIKNITNPNDPEFISNEDLIGAYKNQLMAENVGMGLSVFAGPIGLLPRLGRGKLNDALDARFGEVAGFEDYRDNPQFQELTKDITRGSVLKEEGSALAQGFKDAFAPDFYEKYDAKYALTEYSKLKGTVQVQGYIKGSSENNLDARQQQHFDNAVRDGNKAIADHFELVAKSNKARDEFAKANAEDIRIAQGDDAKAAADAIKRLEDAIGSGKEYNGVRIGMSSLDTIIEYGGSVVSAVDDGRAKAGGTFKKAEVVEKGVAGDKGPIKTASNTKDEGPSLADKLATQAEKDRKQELADAAAAKEARDKLAAAARDRRRERSRDRTPTPTPKPKPKPTRTDDYGRSRRSYGGGGKAKGGLMKGKK